MDSYFTRYHEVKTAEVEKGLDIHMGYMDNAVMSYACFGVYEELAKYLVQRYPNNFRLQKYYPATTDPRTVPMTA